MNEFDRISKGVLSHSQLHFMLHSNFAETALYYLQHVGVFDCNEQYRIDRAYWDTFLLLFVDRGQLDITYRGHTYSATAGDVVFIDCKEPHIYKANQQVSFHHIHFKGNATQQYFDTIYNQNGCVLYPSTRRTMDSMFEELLHQATAQLHNEHIISVSIHTILADLAIACQPRMPEHDEYVSRAMGVIDQYYMDDLPLAKIASTLNLSESYLSHIFKSSTGIALHQHLINVRIKRARHLLLVSNDSIETIASRCGFQSTTHFIRAFKKYVGTTPGSFRKTPI